jgi:hypothetical protein
MHPRFLFTAEFYQNARAKDKGRDGLDGFDAGMAFTLMTQNHHGNFQLWSEMVKDFCPEASASNDYFTLFQRPKPSIIRHQYRPPAQSISDLASCFELVSFTLDRADSS